MAISREEAARLLLEREESLSSYAAYCRMAVWKRGLKPMAHHDLIINAIDDVLTNTAPPRLLVIMPPGSAKSTYGSQLFPGYFFAKMPRGLLVGASHTQDRADEFSLNAMEFARENQIELGYEIGGPSIREAARAWGTSTGGSYRAIGAGRKIAGQRMDFVFADDLVGSSEDVEKREQREKLWRWFWTDLRTRLRPGGRIVLMMTRWHEDDLAGRLLKVARPGEWRVLHIKAEAGQDDILGRKLGEMLWADDPNYAYADELRVTKGDFEASGQMTVWEALFQGNPTSPGGNIFRIENIGIEDAEPAGFNWVRAWDLAASDGKGDFTAGLKLGIGPSKRLVISDVVRLRGGPDEVVRVMKATAERDGGRTVISLPQDPGQAGKAQVAFLTRELIQAASAKVSFEPIEIEFKKLSPYELLKIYELAGEFNNVRGWVGPASIAASVRKIGNKTIAFPESQDDLKMLVSELGIAGIAAATAKMNEALDAADARAKILETAAKN